MLRSKAAAWKMDAGRCTRLKVKQASPGGQSRLGLGDQEQGATHRSCCGVAMSK